MRLQLCNLLAEYAGQELTREVAAAIISRAFPDRSLDPTQFAPGGYGEYTFRCERIGDIVAELEPLHQAHYLETEIYRAGIPLAMNYEALQERCRAGGLLQFTARTAAGELVGQMRVYLSQSMHTQTLIATEDTFFFMPAHRAGFTAVRLWQYADRCGEHVGVTETYFDSKLVNKADRLARYLKYTPISTRFAKVRQASITPKE